MVCPVQTVVSGNLGVMLMVGRTVMVKVAVSPLQPTPFAVKAGTTLMFAITGIFGLLLLTVVKEAMLPVPFGVNPMAVLSFTQL